jgi:two-component system, cell cycle sensor histidine kinase and response regulator CckA
MSRRSREEQLHRYAKEIKKAVDHATTLTGQLLTLSHKQLFQPKLMDLNTVITGMEDMLRRLIGEEVELVLAPGSALGYIKMDPGQLEQVILNLVVNARDAMPQGGKLTIETLPVEFDERQVCRYAGLKAGPHVRLVVSDTGCGMDATIRARLFEPFFTTKQRGKGTGLGLSIVYGIITQSGGHIEVDSVPGRGTQFSIYLPQVEKAVFSERTSPPPPSS